MAPLIWYRVVGAGAIGLLAWRGQLWAIPLSIVVPCLIAVQPSRAAAAATSFAYYAGASLPVIGVGKAYWPSSNDSAILMWMVAATILSLPSFLCWTGLESLRPWTAGIAVALTGVPPICIVGWASPLLSAGVLFPNSAWLGIAAALALPGLLIHNKRTRTITLLVAVAASFFLNAQVKHIQLPTGWTGEMTRIHRPRQADDLADFAIEEQLQHVAKSSGSKVLVFPEGAVRLWTDATDAFWAPAVSDTGKTLLIGAGQPIPGSVRYYNSVVIVGDHARPAFHQRIPVPGGMWNPFQPRNGVALNLLGPGTVDVGGQRAAILICYEQLLIWPILRSAAEKPTVLVAISNEAWTSSTIVPRIQHACVRAWARLFGLPVISAINS
jgi:apolipoprotein N-acyltransferase